MAVEPEYASIESFVEWLWDDERTTYTHQELLRLCRSLGSSPHKLKAQLAVWELKLAERAPERKVRGFQSNPHDRWYGPGAEKMHGGSGHEQISGFAGQKG
jgi:hypothetical protein